MSRSITCVSFIAGAYEMHGTLDNWYWQVVLGSVMLMYWFSGNRSHLICTLHVKLNKSARPLLTSLSCHIILC